MAQLTGEEVRLLRERYVAPAFFSVTDIVIARAEGARLYDTKGKEYLDFASGIAALPLGHGHPEVVCAARAQMERFAHVAFHVVSYEGYVRLAAELDRIVPIKGPTKSILVNSGAEAVENAIKIARAATGRAYIIAFQNSFHGRTYGAMSATGRVSASRLPFLLSLAPHVLHVPYPYPYRPLAPLPADDLADLHIALLERTLETEVTPSHVAAVLVEPVQGEGGFIVPPMRFFARLRALCDQHGILLIADEVQTGFGRTGRMFGLEHWGITADIVAMSKALGAGFPLGAVTGRAELMDRLPAGSLGSTFGGNPIACAAALAMIHVLERDGLVERAVRLGERIDTRFREMASRFACIGDVRGLGAMRAIEIVQDRATKVPAPAVVAAVSEEACSRGLVTIRAGQYTNVIRVLPPLTVADEELERGLDILEASLATVSA